MYTLYTHYCQAPLTGYRTTHTITHAPLDSTLRVMSQPPPSHNTSNMAYKSFTKLTVYSSTGCPPLSLSVTVTCTSLSDNALVATVPMTGAVYRERERKNAMKALGRRVYAYSYTPTWAAESRVYAYKDVRCTHTCP